MARIDYPEAVGRLVEELRRLPGVGPSSAERIAIWLLQGAKADPLALAGALEKAKAEVIACPVCGFFATAERCAICSDHSREAVICVVEQATDVLPLERSGAFKGRYHCLGGKLSPLDNVTPDDLRIGSLLRRIDAEHRLGRRFDAPCEEPPEGRAGQLASKRIGQLGLLALG